MRRWHGGSVLAAVALTRGGNVTIPVDGGPQPALALVDGDDDARFYDRQQAYVHARGG